MFYKIKHLTNYNKVISMAVNMSSKKVCMAFNKHL